MVYDKVKAHEYYLKNKVKFCKYRRSYYLRNRDKFIQYNKDYNARNQNRSNIIRNDDVLLEELRVKIMRELEG